MTERRGPWLVASGLLLVGACTAAGAVRQHWLPCQGQMLSGSILRGFAYVPDFSDACLETMDYGFSFVFPAGDLRWGAESLLGTATALLLALAWAVVVATSRWSLPTRLIGLLPALAGAAAGLLSLMDQSEPLGAFFNHLLLAINLLAVVALVAIAVRERPGKRVLLQVALALGASTAVGAVPSIADYIFMTTFSEADWDLPPGSGYPTAVASALLAVALLVVTLLRPPQAASSSARAAVSALP